MDCDRYKNSISDAALGAPEDSLDSGFRNHLASCSRCCAEFERERSLIASIDRKIVEVLAIEPPPDLTARIRSRLAQGSVPSASPGNAWARLTPRAWLAAAMIGALVVGVSVWKARRALPPQPPAISIAKNAPPQLKAAGTSAQSRVAVSVQRPGRLAEPRHPPRKIIRSPHLPQVLVEKDEAALVLDFYYAVQRGQVNAASLTATPPGFKREKDGTLVPAPLKIEPIEIAALDVGANSGKTGAQHQE